MGAPLFQRLHDAKHSRHLAICHHAGKSTLVLGLKAGSTTLRSAVSSKTLKILCGLIGHFRALGEKIVLIPCGLFSNWSANARPKSGGRVTTFEQASKRAMPEDDAVWRTWFEKVGNPIGRSREYRTRRGRCRWWYQLAPPLQSSRRSKPVDPG
jgi:hypothetical protein